MDWTGRERERRKRPKKQQTKGREDERERDMKEQETKGKRHEKARERQREREERASGGWVRHTIFT